MTENAREDPVRATRRTLLDGVGAEVVASFPGITRLGGQIVAALYFSDGPQSMDTLSELLGRSKSNIFSNLRALEAAGHVEKTRPHRKRPHLFPPPRPFPPRLIRTY